MGNPDGQFEQRTVPSECPWCGEPVSKAGRHPSCADRTCWWNLDELNKRTIRTHARGESL